MKCVKIFGDSITGPREFKMLKYRGYCEAHINKFYVYTFSREQFFNAPSCDWWVFSSLPLSLAHVLILVVWFFPCFKWPLWAYIHPPWQLTRRSGALAGAALLFSSVARRAAFNYAMLLCCRCIYVVHGSFFLHYVPSAHTRRSALCTTFAYIYIYTYKENIKASIHGAMG